jgi:hypothetical protein
MHTIPAIIQQEPTGAPSFKTRGKATILALLGQSTAPAGGNSSSLSSKARQGVPASFDWRAYLKWNPELRLDGIETEVQAMQHWLDAGHKYNLVHQDYNLTLRYESATRHVMPKR